MNVNMALDVVLTCNYNWKNNHFLEGVLHANMFQILQYRQGPNRIARQLHLFRKREQLQRRAKI